jgi:hypothetical protein
MNRLFILGASAEESKVAYRAAAIPQSGLEV